MTVRWLNIRNLSFSEGPIRHVMEIGLILGTYFTYMFVRKYLIPDIEAVSLDNAAKVASFESVRGLLWEPGWQRWAWDHARPLLVGANWAYIMTFIPIITVTAIAFYIKERKTYIYYRNVVILSFVFALLMFALFPLAPPRFLPEYGFIDTIKVLGPSHYANREMAAFYNVYAAMPSLHFGWTVLFGVLFFKRRNPLLKAFGVIYPAMTLFAITITGNHYVIDAMGGASVVLVSFLIYEALLRLKPNVTLAVATARVRVGHKLGHMRDSFGQRRANATLAITAKLVQWGIVRYKGGKLRIGLPVGIISPRAKRT